MDTKDIKREFLDIYGDGTVEVYFAPGRVNLIGEHTDYNGGVVFPCALNLRTFLAVRKTQEKTVTFHSANQDFSAVLSFEQLTSPQGKEWINYPLGVLNQFLGKGVELSFGLELYYSGNIPDGVGLSSSAALEVVTAYALNDLLGTGYDRIELVKMSQKGENEFVGVNCGIMDQFASCMGKANHAIFLNCTTLDYELVPIKLSNVKIVISNTNSPHKLDDGKYNKRVAECKAAVEQISKKIPISQLGELSVEDFASVKATITDDVIRKRASHVITEIKRTNDAVEALKSGNIEKFGKLMNASHVSLRDNYEVTGAALDTMVEEAWKTDGVIGSRMTGGGFGGCTVSLVHDEAIKTFITQVGDNYEKRIGLKPEFYIGEIGDGATKLI